MRDGGSLAHASVRVHCLGDIPRWARQTSGKDDDLPLEADILDMEFFNNMFALGRQQVDNDPVMDAILEQYKYRGREAGDRYHFRVGAGLVLRWLAPAAAHKAAQQELEALEKEPGRLNTLLDNILKDILG